jgi:periplasmic divalent cation tolerance protein
MTDFIQVNTTVGSRPDAERIATQLVDRRLAACVQIIGPVQSTFRWQGKIETSEEWLCVAKTTRAAYPAVEQQIRSLHRYEVPEIVATEIVAGSSDYLAWVGGEVVSPAGAIATPSVSVNG